MKRESPSRRFAFAIAVCALVTSCTTEPESDRLVIEITDETGRALPESRLEVSSDRMGIRVLVADRNGNVVLDDGATDWTLEPRNVDGCPLVFKSSNRSRGGARWSLMSPATLRAKCLERIPYGIRGAPGEAVGWRQTLDREKMEFGAIWSANLVDTTTLDASGRGILRIPRLLSPFREQEEFRILVRGVGFPIGAWWIDPTDSVFTIRPIRFGWAVSPLSALRVGFVTDEDSLTVSWESRDYVLEWRRRGDTLARRADIAAEDTLLRGVWRDAPADSFRWVFRWILSSEDGVLLDTGTGIERGLWLRPPP